MDPERWQQIKQLYDTALELEPARREVFLGEACAGDDSLCNEVKSLLAYTEDSGIVPELPAMQVLARQLAADLLSEAPQDLAGHTLLHYRIREKIGEGGMGVVYKAEDTKLHRFVALKFLPEELSRDRHALERFEREAQAASALNHPNIATIYEIGESDGIHWIAMELVEGQTLAERIKDRPLKMEEILDIGVQAAEALAEAHSKRIIHRDIKPANLMLTPKGVVKILDFGLARKEQRESQARAADTIETPTIPGLVMGTVRYMSPEQVLGQPIDHRTDIFSLGVVLYEMAAGQPPFQGESPSAVLDAIVHQGPAWPPQVRNAVPEELKRIINKALEKFREVRYDAASDLCADLRRLKHDTESGPAALAPVRTKRGQYAMAAVVAAAAALLAVSIWYWFGRPRQGTREIAPPVPLTSYTGIERGASFSPDGNQVAFAWNGEKEDNWDIYVKLIGSDGHLRLTANPARDTWPAWSPDGRQIAFCRDPGTSKRAVVLISPLGSPERILTELVNHADWIDDLFGPFLSWSPDGRALAMYDHGRLDLYMVETGEKHPLTKSGKPDSCPAFSPDGRTLAFRRWVAWANSDLYLLDLSEDLKPVGQPRRLTFQNLATSGVAWGAVSNGGVAWVSDGRALVYSAGGTLWRVASSGRSQPQQLASLGRDAGSPVISPRGSRLVYTHTAFDSDITRIEISSPESKVNPSTQFISSTRFEGFPQYSCDGRKIAFISERSGSLEIWVCDADGSNAIQLTHFGRGQTADERWSPDGSHLAFDSNIEGHPEVYVVNASGGNPQRLTFSSYSENPSWSKDGRWIYFNSAGPEHSIQKVPAEGGPAVLVTRNAPGFAPVESADRKAICVTSTEMGLWRVPIEGGKSRQVLESLANFDAYEVADDGIYFIPDPDPTKGYSIRFLELATGEIRTIAELGKPACRDLAISPDRRWALYTQTDQSSSDLMLVEDFR